MRLAAVPDAAIRGREPKSVTWSGRPLRCRLRLHRMRYAGMQMGRRVERCERCGAWRLRD